MVRYDYVIGIDPDSEKSGVCRLNIEARNVELSTLEFPQLIDYVKNIQNGCSYMGLKLIVVVEAGWLNQSHWHLSRYDSKQLAASKGNAVGRNHQTGKLIVQMLKHNDIKVEEVRPLKKCWKGPDGKITHDEIAYFIPGFPKRSNQETRDAALISWNYANLPIKVKIHSKKTTL